MRENREQSSRCSDDNIGPGEMNKSWPKDVLEGGDSKTMEVRVSRVHEHTVGGRDVRVGMSKETEVDSGEGGRHV